MFNEMYNVHMLVVCTKVTHGQINITWCVNYHGLIVMMKKKEMIENIEKTLNGCVIMVSHVTSTYWFIYT